MIYVPPPEIAALTQALPPSPILQQSLEGYRDLQSVMAVLESQAGFELNHNLARFRQSAPVEMPPAEERVRYLGFFLTQHIALARPLRVQLRFSSYFAHTPLMLLLHAFGIQGKHRLHLTQGLSFYASAEVNAVGLVQFVFSPLSQTLKSPERVTGFMVYLIRPKVTHLSAPDTVFEASEVDDEEAGTGILRVSEGLNVYKRVDTRV